MNNSGEEVFKNKRKPKGEIHFNISLNEEQRGAKATILSNTITVLKGQAGSGKSLLSAQVALDLLFKHEVEKIIITRPTVTAGEDIGFLPGSKENKLEPYTAPTFDNMYRLYDKVKIDKLIEEGQIEIIPVGFIRGRNFTNSIIILDEGQNVTNSQMQLILTRMCLGSKMIICGDGAQVDLKNKHESGFDVICKHFKEVPGFAVVNLKVNHRHPIVENIINVYKDLQ